MKYDSDSFETILTIPIFSHVMRLQKCSYIIYYVKTSKNPKEQFERWNMLRQQKGISESALKRITVFFSHMKNSANGGVEHKSCDPLPTPRGSFSHNSSFIETNIHIKRDIRRARVLRMQRAALGK